MIESLKNGYEFNIPDNFQSNDYELIESNLEGEPDKEEVFLLVSEDDSPPGRKLKKRIKKKKKSKSFLDRYLKHHQDFNV